MNCGVREGDKSARQRTRSRDGKVSPQALILSRFIANYYVVAAPNQFALTKETRWNYKQVDTAKGKRRRLRSQLLDFLFWGKIDSLNFNYVNGLFCFVTDNVCQIMDHYVVVHHEVIDDLQRQNNIIFIR